MNMCRHLQRICGIYTECPSGISERGSATTKIDTAERSVSVGGESLQVCLGNRHHGVLADAETVDRVRETSVRSPHKSTHRASRELQMPQSSVWRIVCKRLRAKGYRQHTVDILGR
jgi:hypothetical protein